MKTITEGEAIELASPLPVALVTSLDKNGRPNALAVAWVTRTSFDPFLITISVDHRRYSHDGIKLNKEFVVNYPSEEQAKGAWICGTKSGRNMDKIKASGLELVDSKAVKVPTLKDATVAFECKVVSELKTGDHTVFAGEVVATRGNPDKTKHLFVTSKHKFFGMDHTGKTNLDLKD